MRGDVPDRQAAGVEIEHPLIKARQPGLALGHELRLKARVAVPRRADLDRPQIGAQHLGGAAVSDVGASRHAARRMPQMRGQLGRQGGLDHAPGELRDQPTRPRDRFRVKALQRLLEQLARKHAIQALHHLRRRLSQRPRPAPLLLHARILQRRGAIDRVGHQGCPL